MPRGRERKIILDRLGQDLARIEKNLGDIDCELRKMRRAKRQQSLYVQPESGVREANEVKPTKDPRDEGAFPGADTGRRSSAASHLKAPRPG